MRRATLATFCVLTAAASGCTHATTYLPSMAMVPMFSKPGESHASAQFGEQGVQIDFAYAIGGPLMLRAMGHTQNREDGHYRLVSAGGGWYLATESQSSRSWWEGLRASLDFDFGIADVKGEERDTTLRRYNGFLYRIGFQADFGAEWKYFEAAVAARMIYYNLRHGDDSSAGSDATANAWLFEPVAILRGGLETVKLELQVGWSTDAEATGIAGTYRKYYGSLGVALELGD